MVSAEHPVQECMGTDSARPQHYIEKSKSRSISGLLQARQNMGHFKVASQMKHVSFEDHMQYGRKVYTQNKIWRCVDHCVFNAVFAHISSSTFSEASRLTRRFEATSECEGPINIGPR